MMARGLHRLWALLSVVDHDALAFTPQSPYYHRPLHSIIIVTLLSYLLAHRNNKSTCWDVFILSPSTFIFKISTLNWWTTLVIQLLNQPVALAVQCLSSSLGFWLPNQWLCTPAASV